ncbi:MAG: hypothetical protein CBC77_002570 [Euryarchaeota archaeon TMED117]|nr:MAG: hypothetical protein CBC77_002570 [Euryarchaeota archaeon TMED117]
MGRGLSAAIVLLCLILQSVSDPSILNEEINSSAPKNSGIDITPVGVSITYSNLADENQYKMFSSNHPIANFNRPAELYVTDSVNSTPMDIEVTVRNEGSTVSGIITLQLLILHNEYGQFELANRTITMNGLSSNGQGTATFFNVYVNYSGNHTLRVSSTHSAVDDNAGNDILSRHYTVAFSYSTCTSLLGWNTGPLWGMNSDAALSMGSSCHIGQGSTGSYNNNMQSSLTTPIWDFSDVVYNPLMTNGITFFYTGSADTNDELKLYAKNLNGAWDELATIAGTVDANLGEWRTISNSNMGHTTPLIPVNPNQHLHSNSQFKFTFTSDSSGTSNGYWIDDIVIIYDQSARVEEYNFEATGISTMGAIPGSWGKITMNLENTGNISDFISPSILNLPQDWNVAYSYASGAGVNPSTGVALLPGESKQIDVKIQPDVNATTGFTQMTFLGTSVQQPTVYVAEPMQFQVLADRIPFIQQPDFKPKCAPGSTCLFEVEVSNIGQATDVFDLNTESKSLANGWSVSLSFDQLSSIRLTPNQPMNVRFLMTVPSDAAPDTTGDFWLTLTAQNDTSRTITEAITIQASMVSYAEIDFAGEPDSIILIAAGETIHVPYTITNQATRQDIFELSVDVNPKIGWEIEPEIRPPIAINPGMTASFYIAVTAPSNGQANDAAPVFKPIVTSTRSSTSFTGDQYDSVLIDTIHDLSLSLSSGEQWLRPGAMSSIQVEIINNGNGPSIAELSLPSIPDSWEFMLRQNGLVLESNFIPLSVSYIGEDTASIEILISVPMSESAGELHEITIEVIPNGMDSDMSDNSITHMMMTGSIRYPSYTSSAKDIHAMINSQVTINGTITNIGNALESDMEIGFDVSTSPPTDDIVAFLTAGVGGPTTTPNSPLTFPMSSGDTKLIIIDLIIGPNVPLNTRIVITTYVEGGLDNDGDIVKIEHQNLILVDEQREVNLEVSPLPTTPIESETTGAGFWINLTSESTFNEDLTLIILHPATWQVICNGNLFQQTEPLNVSLQYSRGDVSEKQFSCTIHRLQGTLEGELTISMSTKDNAISSTDSQIIVFSETKDSEGFMNMEFNAPTIITGGIALFMVMLIALIIRRRSVVFDDDEIQSDELLVTNGPPITNGPPVSTGMNTPTVQTSVEDETTSPVLPETGLPDGWSMEQWEHYGQQYLDRLGKQP